MDRVENELARMPSANQGLVLFRPTKVPPLR
jgi:hypothetical protein